MTLLEVEEFKFEEFLGVDCEFATFTGKLLEVLVKVGALLETLEEFEFEVFCCNNFKI